MIHTRVPESLSTSSLRILRSARTHYMRGVLFYHIYDVSVTLAWSYTTSVLGWVAQVSVGEIQVFAAVMEVHSATGTVSSKRVAWRTQLR